MAEIIPLTKALLEHYAREREPRFRPVEGGIMRRKSVLCFLGWCPCEPMSDDTGCWGQCTRCGKKVGFVDRETLRRACDREAAARELTSDNLRLTTIRPWRPEDDDGGSAA